MTVLLRLAPAAAAMAVVETVPAVLLLQGPASGVRLSAWASVLSAGWLALNAWVSRRLLRSGSGALEARWGRGLDGAAIHDDLAAAACDLRALAARHRLAEAGLLAPSWAAAIAISGQGARLAAPLAAGAAAVLVAARVLAWARERRFARVAGGVLRARLRRAFELVAVGGEGVAVRRLVHAIERALLFRAGPRGWMPVSAAAVAVAALALGGLGLMKHVAPAGAWSLAGLVLLLRLVEPLPPLRGVRRGRPAGERRACRVVVADTAGLSCSGADIRDDRGRPWPALTFSTEAGRVLRILSPEPAAARGAVAAMLSLRGPEPGVTVRRKRSDGASHRTLRLYAPLRAPLVAGNLVANLTIAAPNASLEQVAGVIAAVAPPARRATFMRALASRGAVRAAHLAPVDHRVLSLVRAVLAAPDVLIVEEGTAAPDAAEERHFEQVIAALARRCVVILVCASAEASFPVDQTVRLPG